MKFIETKLKGVFLITIEPNYDDRGYFARTYCHDEFEKHGIDFTPVQTNVSYTKKAGTIRGIHFQTKPFEEDKLIRCIKGKMYDIAVDLRKESPTYKQWQSFDLSEENLTMVYIPKDFAHAFQTLTDDCLFEYQMSQYYSAPNASGVRWNDPSLNIPWPITSNIILSEKDKTLPTLE